MPDLLHPDERAALDAPYGTPEPIPAVFPSTSQLDPEGQTALLNGVRQWLLGVARQLSGLLRMPCVGEPIVLKTLTRGQPAGPPSVRYQLLLDDLPECPIHLSLSRPFAGALCERLFGAPLEMRADRALTAPERSLMADLMTEWTSLLGTVFGDAWLRMIPPSSDDDSMSRTGHEVDDSWVVAQAPLRCGDVPGAFQVSFAPETARRLLGALPPVAVVEPTADELADTLGMVPLTLHAVLGEAEFTLDNLACLRVGDVVTLDRQAKDLLELKIDGRSFFLAKAGLSGQTVALEIVAGPKERINE
jgi:flagellar motor switch/type III secretory pathway protein FliN